MSFFSINGNDVKLSISDCFFKKYSILIAKSDAFCIYHQTDSAVVFSILYGDDVYVFCCRTNVPSVRNGCEIQQIEITSETVMSYFKEKLESQLPYVESYDERVKLSQKKEKCVDVIKLTEKNFIVLFNLMLYFFQIEDSEIKCFKLPLCKLCTNHYDDDEIHFDFSFESFEFYTVSYVLSNRFFFFDIYSGIFDENRRLKVGVKIKLNCINKEEMVKCSRIIINENLSIRDDELREIELNYLRLMILNGDETDYDDYWKDSEEDSEEDSEASSSDSDSEEDD